MSLHVDLHIYPETPVSMHSVHAPSNGLSPFSRVRIGDASIYLRGPGHEERAQAIVAALKPPHFEETPAAAPNEADLRKMMRDPRYWREREPEFVKRVTDGFRQLVGAA